MDPKLSVQTMHVVYNFPNIFPNELLDLPPRWEIKFSIDLIRGMQPISNLAYRMGRTKLSNLEQKISTLQRKKLIRPSHSPWGASVLFLKKKDETLRPCIDHWELN